VVGMTATQFSIADPSDNGMLDLCGFDTTAPSVMSEFAKG
jgi:60 kDa SS-A/Ro ribonucleoprotein